MGRSGPQPRTLAFRLLTRGGIYEPSISFFIKNPALGAFNHLPLRRLRASSPDPCDFGEFGARRGRPGGGWCVWGRNDPRDRRTDGGCTRLRARRGSPAPLLPHGVRASGAPERGLAESGSTRERGLSTHPTAKRRRPRSRWRFGSSPPSSGRPACSGRAARTCGEETTLLASVPSGSRPPHSWERPEGASRVTRMSRRTEASQEERGVGGETSPASCSD